MTKEKLIIEAETLFFTKGFKTVSLQEICTRIRIKPASLYYYFPGGKEELYLEVIERRLNSFRESIQSIALQFNSLEETLIEFGNWYISQAPMNMMLVSDMDMPYLSPAGKKKVMASVARSIFEPLGQLFRKYGDELKSDFDPYYLVGTLSVLLYSAHTAAKRSKYESTKVIRHNVHLFLYGAMLTPPPAG